MIEKDSKRRLEERVRRYMARYDERTLATARKTRARTREARGLSPRVLLAVQAEVVRAVERGELSRF